MATDTPTPADMNRPPIEEIEARLAAATPGPWESHEYGHSERNEWIPDYYGVFPKGAYHVGATPEIGGPDSSLSGEDAELIAHAPTDLVDCIRYIRELEDGHDRADVWHSEVLALREEVARLKDMLEKRGIEP